MDLEFKTQTVHVYELGEQQVLGQEETLETIVPDYCPDIARILQTEGTVGIHNRTMTPTGVQVTGTIRITVLYVPEGVGGVRSLEYAMPFSLESTAMAGCAHVTVQTELEQLDSRTLNPRKLFTHCKLMSRLTGHRLKAQTLCTDVVSPEGCGIETQYMSQKAVVVEKIVEKDCTFAEEMSLSPAKGGATEILMSRVTPQVNETKVMGNKLIFKGVFHSWVLYATGSGAHCTATDQVPFSHIMDIGDQVEGVWATVGVDLTGWEVQLDSSDDEGRRISLTLYAHATAMMRQEQQWTLLDDLYATAYDVGYHRETVQVECLWEPLRRRQTLREVLEIGVVPQAVMATMVSCSPVQVVREGQMVSLRTTAMVKVIYSDESGAALSVQRAVEVTTQMELPVHYAVCVQALALEEPQSVLGERGIEVRFCVDYVGEVRASGQCSCIASGQVDLTTPKDLSGAPSLVLRRLETGMTPWMLAKIHHTTVATILSANQCASKEELPRGELLLIPKKRG
ncbi:DUF3794 domain-containing protein [Bengtsoniella intestinalis]|uniref:DUF3794 domain-containing protein n=1 Tax=Bengtsoniella intestinalis TaxID=3073143 RepID=UPI00391F7B30